MLIISIFFYADAAYAGDPSIVSVSINPTNPGWGQQFNITIQYCVGQYVNPAVMAIAIGTNSSFIPPNTGGQVFLVSNSGIDAHTTNPTSGSLGIAISAGTGPVWRHAYMHDMRFWFR